MDWNSIYIYCAATVMFKFVITIQWGKTWTWKTLIPTKLVHCIDKIVRIASSEEETQKELRTIVYIYEK